MADMQGKPGNQVTREKIIEAAKEAARKDGSTFLSRDEFTRATRITQYFIYRLAPDGGWAEVVRLAGLQLHPLYNAAISDDDLLREFSQSGPGAG